MAPRLRLEKHPFTEAQGSEGLFQGHTANQEWAHTHPGSLPSKTNVLFFYTVLCSQNLNSPVDTKTEMLIMGLCGTGKTTQQNCKEPQASAPQNAPQQGPVRSERWVCSGPDHRLWTQLDLGPHLSLLPVTVRPWQEADQGSECPSASVLFPVWGRRWLLACTVLAGWEKTT